jgi:hypothetical protein
MARRGRGGRTAVVIGVASAVLSAVAYGAARYGEVTVGGGGSDVFGAVAIVLGAVLSAAVWSRDGLSKGERVVGLLGGGVAPLLGGSAVILYGRVSRADDVIPLTLALVGAGCFQAAVIGACVVWVKRLRRETGPPSV